MARELRPVVGIFGHGDFRSFIDFQETPVLDCFDDIHEPTTVNPMVAKIKTPVGVPDQPNGSILNTFMDCFGELRGHEMELGCESVMV